jgi:hypothetical protein
MADTTENARDTATIEEAMGVIIDEVYEIEGMQRLFAQNIQRYPGLKAPGPTAMRKAFVLRHAATILQIVHENSEEFKQMIANKRAKARRRKKDV